MDLDNGGIDKAQKGALFVELTIGYFHSLRKIRNVLFFDKLFEAVLRRILDPTKFDKTLKEAL